MQDQRMRQVITEEVQDLPHKGTYKVIIKKELPDSANALVVRFVLAIKSRADGKIKFKARYVIVGRVRHPKTILSAQCTSNTSGIWQTDTVTRLHL